MECKRHCFKLKTLCFFGIYIFEIDCLVDLQDQDSFYQVYHAASFKEKLLYTRL